MEKKKIILHDLPAADAQRIIGKLSEANVFWARETIAPCKGCFGCWLQTPGVCVLRDKAQMIGSRIAESDEVIIVSENRYGGFSREIKNVMDRSIALCLPFFTVREGEMHHKPRYENRPVLRAIFYNAADMTSEEQALARDIVHANGLNFNAARTETVFADSMAELEEALA